MLNNVTEKKFFEKPFKKNNLMGTQALQIKISVLIVSSQSLDKKINSLGL